MMDKVLKFHRHNLIFGNYPGSLTSATVCTFLVNGSYAFGVDLSFGLIRLIQDALNLQGFYVAGLSCTASALVFWASLCTARKFLLRRLLQYTGWVYDGSKPSRKTKFFAYTLRLLDGWFRISERSLYGLQGILPSLPVPSLQQTVTRYLDSMKPLLTPEKFATLEKLAEDFLQDSGPKFQKYLLLKSWFSPNYISDWWEKYIYLVGRSSTMINSNFYVTDMLDQREVHQAARAATITFTALKFRRKIEKNCLTPLIGNGMVPFCSWQYERMFNTVRVPGEEEDVIQHEEISNHIAVRHKGRFFQVPICHANQGNRHLSLLELQDQFLRIIKDESEPCEGEENLAALTSWDRTNWAKTRSKFFMEGTNQTSLEFIEKAVFMIVLDDVEYSLDVFGPNGVENVEAMSKRVFHGTGSNLWIDKSINFIVSTNGLAGTNIEHSWADAPVTAHMWERHLGYHMQLENFDENGLLTPTSDKTASDTVSKYKSLPPPPPPQRLVWELPKDCLEAINSAQKSSLKQIDDLDMKILVHDAFGKGLMKKFRCSPDAFIQMSLQLAYYRDQGQFDATYEASMTRLFKQGRTETIRSCSQESCRWVLAMENNLPLKEKINLFYQACERHQDTYRKSMTGDGIDRHLFGLYVVSKYLKLNSDFLNEALSSVWRLSTSQTPYHPESNKSIVSPGGGFGTVAHDGYGVSYLFSGENVLFFHVNSNKSCSTTNSSKFAAEIQRALGDVRALFEQVS